MREENPTVHSGREAPEEKDGKWKREKFGRTDLFVTKISWGCAPLGHLPEDFGGGVDETEAEKILQEEFKGPINFFDTANVYGESEQRIGKAIMLTGGLPEGFIIATKADRDKKTGDFSAGQIRKSVEMSIARLGIDHLPLVYLHDPEYHPLYLSDKEGAIREILASDGPIAELEKMKEKGIISYIGISGGPIDMLIKYIETGRFDAVITHNRWNLLWQVAEPLLDKAHKMGIGIVNAGAYASGILAAGPIEGIRAVYQKPSQDIIERVKNMKIVCEKYGIPLAAAALQFSLRDKRIGSTAVGIIESSQVEETLRLVNVPIPKQLWEDLKPFAIGNEDPEKDRWTKS